MEAVRLVGGRLSFHWGSASAVTRSRSVMAAGCHSAARSSRYSRYFSFFSHQRTTEALLRPCLTALRAETALPSAVFGPRDFWPLRREASLCASVRSAGIKKGPSFGADGLD